jgi:hypothetical protein
MQCPHCHKEIPGRVCPACGEAIPFEGNFCMECGSPLEEERPVRGDEAFDLDKRVLCPDGTCTGIIVDGKCTECGKRVRESEPR